MNLADKVVLITGAREGIGAACAREFRKRGARLSLIDIRPGRPEEDDGEALWTVGDITEEAVRQEAVARTSAHLGPVDVIINNAGIGLYASPSETSPAFAERLFAVNVSAAVGLTRLVVPQMRKRRSGAVINIESIGALVSLPWCAMYCASKHALHAYTRSLHHELRGDGIHVMSVIPGIVNTRFREHVLGGDVPGGVAGLKRSISAGSLAASVAVGLEKRKNMVVNPRIGWAFWAADLLLPQVMHWYFRRCWTAPDTLSSPGVRRAAASAECDPVRTSTNR